MEVSPISLGNRRLRSVILMDHTPATPSRKGLSASLLARALWLILALLADGKPARADSAPPQLAIIALFPGKVLVNVNGKSRALAVGETSPEGVKLLAATAESATLEVNARRVVLSLDGKITTTFSERPRGHHLRLAPGTNGHYFVDGAINGNAVQFMVDTGASMIAINKHMAKKLGLLYRTDGTLGQIETASGLVRAYYLKFKNVKARTLELHDVEGVVVDGDFPTVALLGQSFLNRFNMRREGLLLELEEK